MSELRIPGVLQRLAVSYGTVALIQIHYAGDYVSNPHRVSSQPTHRGPNHHLTQYVALMQIHYAGNYVSNPHMVRGSQGLAVFYGAVSVK